MSPEHETFWTVHMPWMRLCNYPILQGIMLQAPQA
jgi:hypothetical protein